MSCPWLASFTGAPSSSVFLPLVRVVCGSSVQHHHPAQEAPFNHKELRKPKPDRPMKGSVLMIDKCEGVPLCPRPRRREGSVLMIDKARESRLPRPEASKALPSHRLPPHTRSGPFSTD